MTLQEQINDIKADVETYRINAIYPNVYSESLSRAWTWPYIETLSYLHGAYVFCQFDVSEELSFLKSIINLKDGE